MVELVEDDFLFSLSTDYEDFDAEETDRKYEKEKQGKNKKTKNSMKLSKKKKKRNVISDSSDSSSDSDSHLHIVVDEPLEKLEKEDSTPEPKVQDKNPELWVPWFRAKNTLYNTSRLTGW